MRANWQLTAMMSFGWNHLENGADGRTTAAGTVAEIAPVGIDIAHAASRGTLTGWQSKSSPPRASSH